MKNMRYRCRWDLDFPRIDLLVTSRDLPWMHFLQKRRLFDGYFGIFAFLSPILTAFRNMSPESLGIHWTETKGPKVKFGNQILGEKITPFQRDRNPLLAIVAHGNHFFSASIINIDVKSRARKPSSKDSKESSNLQIPHGFLTRLSNLFPGKSTDHTESLR